MASAASSASCEFLQSFGDESGFADRRQLLCQSDSAAAGFFGRAAGRRRRFCEAVESVARSVRSRPMGSSAQ